MPALIGVRRPIILTGAKVAVAVVSIGLLKLDGAPLKLDGGFLGLGT